MTNQPTIYKGLRLTIELSSALFGLLSSAAFALTAIPPSASGTAQIILAVLGGLVSALTSAILRGLALAVLDIADNSRR